MAEDHGARSSLDPLIALGAMMGSTTIGGASRSIAARAILGGMSLHEAARAGFSNAADAYERGRPSYPAEVVRAIVDRLGLRPGVTLLDLGAGTGKLTRLLVPSGATLLAVEPVRAMRDKLTTLVPEARALEGTAEAIPLADASVDAVIVAQAFHWFDGDRALAEIHRVLRPGGRLGLVWNHRDESVPWVRAATALLDAHAGDAPTYRSGAWRAAFERTEAFTPLEEIAFDTAQEVDAAGLDDRFGSVSYVAAMPEADRAALLAEVRRVAVEAHGGDGTRFRIPYRTSLYVCRPRGEG